MADTPAQTLAEQISAFRSRRSWPHMIAMFVGGWSAFIGVASVASNLTKVDRENALPMAAAVTIYLVSVALYAWGAARFDVRAWPRWFVLTVLSAGLLIVLMFLTRFAPVAQLFIGRVSGPLPGTAIAAKSDFVTALADEQLIARLLGGEAGPPTVPFSRARSSMAVWKAAGPVGREPATVSMKVTDNAALAWRVRKAAARPSSGMRAIGGDGVFTRRQINGGEHLNVTAARRSWVISIAAYGRFAADPEPDLLALAVEALDRLDAPVTASE